MVAVVRNIGIAIGYEPRGSIKMQGSESFLRAREFGKIEPHGESRAIILAFNEVEQMTIPAHFNVNLRYSDFKEHLLEFTFCLLSVSEERCEIQLVAARLDGEHHPDHPPDPATEMERRALEHRGLLPIPDDL
jgi:hypothetical protein